MRGVFPHARRVGATRRVAPTFPLPLAEQLAYVRRKMLMAGLRLGANKEREEASAGAMT